MSLIDDNQVEPTDGERFLLAIDVIDHGLIRTEQDACIQVRLTVVTQDASAFVRKQLGIVLGSLTHQRSTVGQEQHVLYPIVPLQHFGERYGYTSLPCTGCHYQKRTSVLLVEAFAHRTDGTLLILTVRNLVLDAQVGDVCPSPALNQQLQFFRSMESQQRTPRITQTIIHLDGVSIAYIDNRTHPVFLFQTIGIELGLYLSFLHTHTGALGFYHGQRTTVCPEEYIVGISFTAIGRHAFHFYFYASL